MVTLDQSPYMQEHLLIKGIIHHICVPTSNFMVCIPKITCEPGILKLCSEAETCLFNCRKCGPTLTPHSSFSVSLHLNNEKSKNCLLSKFRCCGANSQENFMLYSVPQMAVVLPLLFGGNLLEYYLKIPLNPFIVLSMC